MEARHGRGDSRAWWRKCSMSALWLIAESDHKIEPIPDSFYTKLGRPASLFRTGDYPIEAVCLICGRPVVAESFLADWVHFERETF